MLLHAGSERMNRQRILALLLLLGGAATPPPLRAQDVDVPGVVQDATTRRGIADVILRVEGTDVSAASDEAGRFVLRSVPPGTWILLVDHLGYGSHRHAFTAEAGQAAELQIRLTAEAIELEPLVVTTMTARDRRERAQGASLHVVDRPQIERALGTSKHMGDLIRQTIPGIRLRQTNNLAGTNVCLEFRGAASISLMNVQSCAHPMVLLDGVVVSDPNFLYGTVGLSNIERIQVIPPADAGARYGTGSLYGVILIDTRPPGRTRLADDRVVNPLGLQRGRVAFDWNQDPAGHALTRTAGAAFLGNALGLVAGVSIGRQCLGINAKDEIVTSCSGTATAGAIAAAMILPAVGSALGARWGGSTDASVGTLLPAVLGAGMMVFPGYAFSMSTVGGGSKVANAVGNTLLVVGAPLVVTLADRLFRSLRNDP